MCEKSFFVLGGCFIKELLPYLKTQYNVSGMFDNISLLCDYVLVNDKYVTLEQYLLDAISLRESDYLILDLQLLEMNCIISSGMILTETSEVMAVLETKSPYVIKPEVLPQNVWKKKMDRIIRLFRSFFAASNIILIHTHRPDFYVVGERVRGEVPFVYPNGLREWLSNVEDYFVEETKCYCVDTTRFYFYKKRKGKKFTVDHYEEECFLDIMSRINEYVSSGKKGRKRPIFEYSLKRFAKYESTLYKKALKEFLDEKYFLDNIILSSDKKFIDKFFDELIILDTLGWDNICETIEKIQKLNISEEIKNIIRAYYQLLNGEYLVKDIDYSYVFKYGVVPQTVLEFLQKKYAEQNVVVNRYNAGIWFSNYVNSSSDKIEIAPYINEYGCKYPTVIDIFGSCISRTCFNLCEWDFYVQEYYFHVPPFEPLNKEVDYPPNLFPEKPSWTDRLVKAQFDKKIFDKMLNSTSEWIIIDLFFLVTPIQYVYDDCYYTDFSGGISKKLNAKKVLIHKDSQILGEWKEIYKKTEEWCSIIRKKYNNKIILINGGYSDYWIGDENKIYRTKQANDSNRMLDEAFEYYMNKFECYGIDYRKHFVTDDVGYIRNLPAHFEDEFYILCHDTIRYIVDNIPSKKLYNNLPNSIRLKQMLRLKGENAPSLINTIYPLSELDKVIVSLDKDIVAMYESNIKEIYENDWTTVEEVYSNYDFSKCTALWEKIKNISIDKINTVDYQNLPVSYLSERTNGSSFVTRNEIMYNIGFDTVCWKHLLPDRSTISISWSAPLKTLVQIERRQEFTDWEVVAINGSGSYIDKNIESNSDYYYRLSTIKEKDGIQWRGNFTKEYKVHTTPDVPTMLNVIRIGRKNIIHWKKVDNVEGYLIYKKINLKASWNEIAKVDFKNDYWEEDENSDECLYTVRAYNFYGEIRYAGGHSPGMRAVRL